MTLMPANRRDRIVAELRANGMLRATNLAERLGVSPVTIRRDLTQLTAEGVVRRVHGGATLVDRVRPIEESPSLDNATIGVLVPSLEYYWPGVIQGAKVEAEERGARLLLRGTSYGSTADRMQVTQLLNSGADGLLIAPDVSKPETAALLGWLDEACVPTVLVERDARLPGSFAPVESVNTDHTAGARMAVQHLAELGHQRVGFMTSSRSPHKHEIRAGWDAAVHDLGLIDGLEFTLEFSPTGTAKDDFAVIEAAFHKATHANVTALLVHADREAMTLTQLAQHNGLSMPGDLSIVAWDDEVAELFTPPLTAVHPPRASIGRAAVQLLLDRLADPDRPRHRVILAPKLNIRGSTGPR